MSEVAQVDEALTPAEGELDGEDLAQASGGFPLYGVSAPIYAPCVTGSTSPYCRP